MSEPASPRPLSPGYVARAADALAVLSHETRLHAVLLVAVLGEVNVSTLADALDVAPSNLSHHLRILRDAGLLADRRDGQFILYRIDVPTWEELSDGFFDSLLGGQDSVTLRNIRIERTDSRSVSTRSAKSTEPSAADDGS